MDTQWLALSGNPVITATTTTNAARHTNNSNTNTITNITNNPNNTYNDHLPDFATATTPYLPRTSILTEVATGSDDKHNRSLIIRDNPLFPIFPGGGRRCNRRWAESGQ